MYPAIVGIVLDLILLFWLGILSYLFWKEKSFFNRLFPKKSNGADTNAALLIRDNFEKLVESVEGLYEKSEVLDKRIKNIGIEGLVHLQKYKISRYNPYADTGGNQSFSIIMMDGKQNGYILSSLHSRSGTRIYIKPVLKGKADQELSKEEKEILAQAVKE